MSEPEDKNVCEKTPKPSGQHCWHRSTEQHTVRVEHGEHIDENCCWCSAKRGRDVLLFDPRHHGPNAP